MSAPRNTFVLGCQRSGTTLLRFLLAAHADVRSIDEDIAYPVLAGRRRLEQLLGAPPTGAVLAYKIPRFSEQLLEPDIRDETYGRCPQFYRGEPALFVVRDPRDVVASMCSLRAGRDASWVATYGRAMIEHRIAERASFAAQHEPLLDELHSRDWPEHLTAAAYWLVKNGALPAYVEAGLPILPLAYERLVRDTEPSVRAICEHLGLEPDPRMLRHQDVDHDQLQPSGLAIGDSDPRRAIDEQSIGRHRQLLDAAALLEVDRWTRDVYLAALRLTERD